MKKGTKLSGLMTLAVFTVFALCVLAVLLTGARAYEKITNRSAEQYSARTAASYAATRIRQAQTVALEDFGGCPALRLTETAEGQTYVTRVYWYEGWIRELYSTPSAPVSPEDGEKVIQAEGLELSLEGELLTVRVDSREVILHIPRWKEGTP